MDIISELKTACKEAGTNLTELCREAGVDRSVVERWKNKPPKSFETLIRLNAALSKLKYNRHDESKAVPNESGAGNT